jgi:hypothetical protein
VFLIDGVRVSEAVYSRRQLFGEHPAAEFDLRSGRPSECVEVRRSGFKKTVRKRRRSRSMTELVGTEFPTAVAWRAGGRPPSLTDADLKKARALLRSGDYTKNQVAQELGVGRHTLWRRLAGTADNRS